MNAAVKDVSNFTTTCTITTVEGIDKPGILESSTENTASLQIGSGSSITINNGGSLVVGSLNIAGGSIAIQAGGQIKLNTPIYIADGDADGYPNAFTFYTATASGRRRLGFMRDFTTVDCGDSNYSTANQCCVSGTYYADSDGDGYGTGAAIQMCPAAGYVANNTDCNDANASLYRSVAGYRDNDGDGYGAGAYTTCAGAAGSYVASNTDCYDSNANARPGSATCSSTHRGDGSYDYNCSGTNTICGTTLNYSASSYLWTGQHGTGSCNNNNADCRPNSATLYASITSSYGQTAATCTLIGLVESGCGDCGESPNSFNACKAVSVSTQQCQ